MRYVNMMSSLEIQIDGDVRIEEDFIEVYNFNATILGHKVTLPQEITDYLKDELAEQSKSV